MSISTKEFPKQAVCILQDYINIRAEQPDTLRQKIENTFDALRINKKNISAAKQQIPLTKQNLIATQKTWLGWIVVQLNVNNCLLSTIARIFCCLFPAFKIEVEKQKEMQKSIDVLQEHRVSKQQNLEELKLLQKELKEPTIFSNKDFLDTLLAPSVYPVLSLLNYHADIEDLSIENIQAPIVSGVALNEDGGRDFFTIIAKTPDKTFRGLIFYEKYLPTDFILSDQVQGINWTTRDLPGLKPYPLPEKDLVINGFIQETFYTFLTKLIQKGRASWIFEKDGERWFTSYTLATPEEVASLHNKSLS
jgi:hypothetical protein